ncbi:protein kinase [Pseudonocardia benzenivorans]
MTTLAAGLHIADRYRLDRRIAVGGMGEVWEASDTRLDRAVAVKVLRPELSGDEEFLHRFRIEARTVASLDHSGIALVHDYGEDDAALGERRTAYLVMELVRGEPLSNRISRGRMDSDETLRILEHAAWALDAAHQRGFVHRDVKPGNILLRDDGVVKLTDFGIAKAANAVPVTRSGMVMGTAHYIAPEQASGGEAGPAGDVYSLGIVGYECLAGKRPFRAENPVVVAMMQVRDEPPPLPDDVPDEVRRLIETVLVKDPAQRYRDGAELARAVAAVRRGEPVPRPSGVADDLDPDGSPAAGPRQAGRRPSTVAGTAGSGGPRSGAASAGPGPEVGGPESEGTAEPQRRRSRRARRMAEERGSDEDRRAALTAAEGRVAAAAGRWARARTRSAHRADGSSDDAPAAPGPYLADARTDTGDGTDASRAATGRDSAAGQGDDVRHRAADGAGEAPGRHTAPAHAAAAQAPPETSVRPPVSDPLAGTPYPEPRSGPLAAPVSGSVSGSLSDSLPRSFVGPPPESPMSGSPYVEPSPYLDPSPYAESASNSSSYVESPPYPGTSASVEASSYVESPPPGSHTTRPGTGAAPGSPGHGAPGHDTPGRGSQPQDVPRSPARGSGPAHAAAAPSAAPAGAAHATQTGAGTTHPARPRPGPRTRPARTPCRRRPVPCRATPEPRRRGPRPARRTRAPCRRRPRPRLGARLLRAHLLRARLLRAHLLCAHLLCAHLLCAHLLRGRIVPAAPWHDRPADRRTRSGGRRRDDRRDDGPPRAPGAARRGPGPLVRGRPPGPPRARRGPGPRAGRARAVGAVARHAPGGPVRGARRGRARRHAAAAGPETDGYVARDVRTVRVRPG